MILSCLIDNILPTSPLQRHSMEGSMVSCARVHMLSVGHTASTCDTLLSLGTLNSLGHPPRAKTGSPKCWDRRWGFGARGPATGSGKQCKPPTPRVLMLFVFSAREMTSEVAYFFLHKIFWPQTGGPGSLNRLNPRFLRHCLLWLHVFWRSSSLCKQDYSRSDLK